MSDDVEATEPKEREKEAEALAQFPDELAAMERVANAALEAIKQHPDYNAETYRVHIFMHDDKIACRDTIGYGEKNTGGYVEAAWECFDDLMKQVQMFADDCNVPIAIHEVPMLGMLGIVEEAPGDPLPDPPSPPEVDIKL